MGDFDTIESLFQFRNPLGASFVEAPDTTVLPLPDLLKGLVLHPGGKIYSFVDIHKKLTDNLTKAPAESKQEYGAMYHIIGSDAQMSYVDFGDISKKYWSGVNSLGDIVPELKSAVNFKASAFVVKDPYVAPSGRGVYELDIFLNYTPSILAAQLVPCLDVTFQITDDQSGPTQSNRPSSMRFLLGSRDMTTSDVSPIDRALVDASLVPLSVEGKEVNGTVTSYSGMEMFLMPQSLSNMDSAGYDLGTVRLVRPKPFLPFASIEGLDITVLNAGAGKFTHKKATLRMKIHDKSRMSEFSEFIRGAPGFRSAVVWTTYGWLAPRGRGEEDPFSKFINDNMMMRECWSVINANYSFDQTGQMTMTLEMILKGSKTMDELTVAHGGAGSPASALDDFNKALQTISDIKAKISGESSFTLSGAPEQVLNAAAGGSFASLKKDVNVDKAQEQLIAAMKKNSALEKDVSALSSAIEKVKNNASVVTSVQTYVQGKFDKLADGPDPFLPSDANISSGAKTHDADLLRVINEYNSKSKERNAEIAKKLDEAKKSKDKDPPFVLAPFRKEVISFGKLFLDFVVPGIASSAKCNELQVVFYGLNDSCGPISGHSIAEFPIALTNLGYAYAEEVKSSGTDALTIQSFLGLVIGTQFTDQRAIGYGMNSFFKSADPTKLGTVEELPKEASTKGGKSPADMAADGMIKWASDYGSLQLPLIEMQIETHDAAKNETQMIDMLKADFRALMSDTGASSTTKIIKKIHIYDKQNNPYKLAQKILNTAEGYELGEVDTDKIDAKFSAFLKSKLTNLQKEALKAEQEKQSKLIAAIQATGADYKKSLQEYGATATEIAQFDIIKQPQGMKIQFGRDRRSLKEALKTGVPTINVGYNGSLVSTVQASSKTDGQQGTLNLMNSIKGTKSGKSTMSSNRLEESGPFGGLPMRTVPMQLTMMSLGCPTAQLYQNFFIDLDTGTTIDNLYICTQIQHNIAKGKFTTQWTFSFSNGYGKFSVSQSSGAQITGAMASAAKALGEQNKDKAKPAPAGKSK